MTLLFRKPVVAGEIVTIKMQSAEELIARLESETADSITVSKPFTLTYSSGGVGMTNWIVTIEPGTHVTIPKDKIIVMAVSAKFASDQYIESTTGIKTVGKI